MKLYKSNLQNNLSESTVELKQGRSWENGQLCIFPDTTFQSFLGMGGAFTEAAAYVWSKLNAENQQEILNLYFAKNGSNYGFCRLHIQSCDFALDNYQYLTENGSDTLKTFNIERDKKYILPFVKAALKVNPDIEFLASPWSPCDFMKSNKEMNHGGNLLEEYAELWAKTIALYVKEYRSEGINIKRLTVQNEPEATQTWDSCRYTAAEERDFAVNHLKGALKELGLDDIKINVWDHNKELLVERARECFATKESQEALDGIAFHWYTGDHFEQIEQVAREYPQKELIFTEGCVEYSKFEGSDDNAQIRNAEMYAHDIIGDLNAGAHAFIDWNLILDSKGGPNHVGNFCDAPILCNVENDDGGKIKINKSFYYIQHFSRFIQKGAKRLFVSRYTTALECVAYKNPDGSVVSVVLNKTDKELGYALNVCGDDAKNATITLEPHSIVTMVF